MVGLIVSSIVSGLIVSRTGRYKWLIVGAIVVMGIATALMTQLTADTPLPIVWLWMFIAGLGVGPTFSVFTIIVQNAVPFQELGVATSNLTFFRQIGGSVALAIVGTIFGIVVPGASSGRDQRGRRARRRWSPGSPRPAAAARIDFNKLTGVGDLGAAILASVPAPVRGVIEPFIANIVTGIHEAFSLGRRPDLLGRRHRGRARRRSQPQRCTSAAPAAPAPVTAPTPRSPRTCRRLTDLGRRPSAPTASSLLQTGPDADNALGAGSMSGRLRSAAMNDRARSGAGPGAATTAADFPPRLAAPGADRRAVRPASSRSPSCRPGRCGGSSTVTSTSCSPTRRDGHRRGRRSLPAHGGAAVDRRARGCVVACPLHNGQFDLRPATPVRMPTTGGLDPDGALPPDLVAGRPRAEGRSARARRPRRAG